MVERLSEAERAEALAGLPGWAWVAERDAIRRVFTFADFSAAWGFMARAALAAERMDHHPEWLNVWNRVEVLLTTHDAEGLSRRDVEMARAMDALADA